MFISSCGGDIQWRPRHTLDNVPQVERPSEALPPAAEAALQVAARVFAYESRVHGDQLAVLARAPHSQLPPDRGRCVCAGTLLMSTGRGHDEDAVV